MDSGALAGRGNRERGQRALQQGALALTIRRAKHSATAVAIAGD